MNFLKLEQINDFYIVTLNRPEVKNAFHPQMIQEITDTFKNLQSSLNSEKNATQIKAIILKGEGTAFCAGADLSWMKDMVNYSFEENKADSYKLLGMFEAIHNCKIPVIGMIHGAVFGGALGLIACCDYVYAEAQTKLCFSEVKLGLIPAVISGFILNKCAEGLVRPYMLSAEVFDPVKAQHMGLVHKIFNGQLEVSDIMNEWISQGTRALKEMKELLSKNSSSFLSSHYKEASVNMICEARVGEEAQTRLKAFLNKI